MGFGGGGGKNKVHASINITPLVDVVLVLLIIFMVLTPILLKQLEIAVPQKADVETSPPPVTSEQVVIRVDADGSLAINGAGVSRDLLADHVRTIFASRRAGEKVMFFDVDDRANYGEVVGVMDTCRGAGVKVLGIMTKN